MTAWSFIAEGLAASGIPVVFGLPGDGGDLFTALDRHPEIRVVAARDQRNATFMAWGYGQLTGLPAVCALSAGPGFTNSLTALLEISSAAAPLVVLVAAPPLTWRERGGFQALDHLALVEPLVRWKLCVTDPLQLPWALQRAFFMASNGLPGPVVLEIPDGLAEPVVPPPTNLLTPPLRCQADPDSLQDVTLLCQQAQRPALILGGGARRSGAGLELSRLARLLDAPLFLTASGRGSIDETHEGFLGLSGPYALPETLAVLKEADLFLVWGSRLEETATLGWQIPAADTPLVQIDISTASLGLAYPSAMSLLGDCRLVAQQLYNALMPLTPTNRRVWRERVQQAQENIRWHVQDYLQSRTETLPIALVASTVMAVFGNDRESAVLAQENGLLDMWGFHYPFLQLPARTRVIVPAEQTAMGCSAAAALGAAIATDSPVVCIVGDGAFHFILAELRTAVAEQLGVTYVVLDNSGYGWVRYRQAQCGSRPVASTFQDTTSIEQLPQAMGIATWNPKTRDELTHALRQAYQENLCHRPAVVRIPDLCDEPPPGVIAAYGPAASPAEQRNTAEGEKFL